jgi:lysophospholipase
VSLDDVRAARAIDRRAVPGDARESRWNARDGHAVRRIDWTEPNIAGERAPRGSLLFLPGRGDHYEKYLETLAYWHSAGWRVTALDWRGQAGSGRLGPDAVTGHIDDFALWIDDLADFWAQWREDATGPCVLVAHSMGGHLALRALAEHRVDPVAAVLTSPMLGLRPRFAPPALLHGVARLASRLGGAGRPAWKWSEKPGALPASRADLLTHDPERYADEVWWREARPELVMGPGSWGWITAALASIRRLNRAGALEAVETPVLLVATTADKLVEYSAIERAAQRLPHGELVRFGAEARHEILREADPVRESTLAAIDEFLNRTALVT